MITISEVPTKTPMPKVEIRRNCDCDKVSDSGKRPARKDLSVYYVRIDIGYTRLHHETYAMAIMMLKESRVTSPSSILKKDSRTAFRGRFSWSSEIGGDMSFSGELIEAAN